MKQHSSPLHWFYIAQQIIKQKMCYLITSLKIILTTISRRNSFKINLEVPISERNWWRASEVSNHIVDSIMFGLGRSANCCQITLFIIHFLHFYFWTITQSGVIIMNLEEDFFGRTNRFLSKNQVLRHDDASPLTSLSVARLIVTISICNLVE